MAACAAPACKHDGRVLRPDAPRASGLPASVPESAPAFIPHPSVCAEERRSRRIRASDCLSRRRVRARPRLGRAPQVSLRSVSEGGTQTVGAPFSLLTFFLATQKESELPPGNPRPVGEPQAQEGKDGFDKLSPNGKRCGDRGPPAWIPDQARDYKPQRRELQKT